MPLSSQLLGDLELHQLLRQYTYPFSQKVSLLHASLAQHVDECHSQFLGHRYGSLITDLDNRDENHPMAVCVNSLPIYTDPGTLSMLLDLPLVYKRV